MTERIEMPIRAIKGKGKDGGYDLPGNIRISKRELDALVLVSRGLSNTEAAEKISVSTNTFRNHVYNVMRKLGASNRAHALLTAIEKGMLEVGLESDTTAIVDDYVLCWKCKRAYPKDDYRMRSFEPIVVDHVVIEREDEEACAYEDCKGKHTEDVIGWSRVREEHPEYPEIPEKGVVYQTKVAPWYWIEMEKGYEIWENREDTI
jgi:DNA-binding CsgD family transcriptional regulator